MSNTLIDTAALAAGLKIVLQVWPSTVYSNG